MMTPSFLSLEARQGQCDGMNETRILRIVLVSLSDLFIFRCCCLHCIPPYLHSSIAASSRPPSLIFINPPGSHHAAPLSPSLSLSLSRSLSLPLSHGCFVTFCSLFGIPRLPCVPNPRGRDHVPDRALKHAAADASAGWHAIASFIIGMFVHASSSEDPS